MQYLDGAFCEAALKRQRRGMHQASANEALFPHDRLRQGLLNRAGEREAKAGPPADRQYLTARATIGVVNTFSSRRQICLNHQFKAKSVSLTLAVRLVSAAMAY